MLPISSQSLFDISFVFSILAKHCEAASTHG
jgi:hypothetical protein